jgi:uncharacterized protein YndB with AHSA1/START domain
MTTSTASAVFQIDIAAPPEAVWRAITDPELTARYYYGGSFEADLRAGCPYRFVNHTEGDRVDIDGEILEVEPGRRLVMSQHFLWEPELRAEPSTKITWELLPIPTGTRLRVIHDLRDRAPMAAKAADGGMTIILDGLKATTEAL